MIKTGPVLQHSLADTAWLFSPTLRLPPTLQHTLARQRHSTVALPPTPAAGWLPLVARLFHLPLPHRAHVPRHPYAYLYPVYTTLKRAFFFGRLRTAIYLPVHLPLIACRPYTLQYPFGTVDVGVRPWRRIPGAHGKPPSVPLLTFTHAAYYGIVPILRWLMVCSLIHSNGLDVVVDDWRHAMPTKHHYKRILSPFLNLYNSAIPMLYGAPAASVNSFVYVCFAMPRGQLLPILYGSILRGANIAWPCLIFSYYSRQRNRMFFALLTGGGLSWRRFSLNICSSNR